MDKNDNYVCKTCLKPVRIVDKTLVRSCDHTDPVIVQLATTAKRVPRA